MITRKLLALKRRKLLPRSRQESGFTLIELITVLVVLAALAALGSSFVVSAVRGFYETQERTKLINHGRQAIEQLSRQLRYALPNSLRVSSTSQCIEFLPVVGSANYIESLPDAANGASASATISTSPVSFAAGSAAYLSVGALAASEIYFGSPPASLALVNSVNTAAIPNTVNLGSAKAWLRNSAAKRLFLLGKPEQFCMLSNQLTHHTNYTTGAYPANSDLGVTPPNTGDLMAENVSLNGDQPFSISTATESRNTVISIVLPLSNNIGDRVVLRHQVMVRNVP